MSMRSQADQERTRGHGQGRQGSGRIGKTAASQRRAQGPPPGEPPVARYRLRYAKRGNARYLSHLDTIKALNRAFRRAGLPIALSGGYNPQPKAAYATALAVGVESECEYVDLEFAHPMDLLELTRKLSAVLPTGIQLRETQAVRLRGPALQSYAAVSRYVVRPRDAAATVWPDLAERIESLQGHAPLTVTRHGGRQVDIRPYLRSITRDGDALVIELGADGRGAGRVDEVLTLLGLDPSHCSLLKTDFWPLVEECKISTWQA